MMQASSAREAQHLYELRPGSVPARGLIREDPVQNLALELTFFILVQRAHAYVPDPRSGHCCLQPFACEVES
jgi:hypothetical protein